MPQCTAPIRGHRSAAAAAACPVCGSKYGRYNSYYYSPYESSSYISSAHSRLSGNSGASKSLGGGSKRNAKWSPSTSTVLYTPAQIATLTPIRESIVKQIITPETYDLFLCHAWDDRKSSAKVLCDKLTKKGLTVWFSEKDLQLGTTMLREIDKGLAKSRAGIVLVTPAF